MADPDQARAIEKLSSSIDKLGALLNNIGRGGAGGSSGGAGGGARGSASLLDLARKGAGDLFGGRAFGGGAAGLGAAGVASAGVAAAAIAAPIIGGGLVNASRGGTFAAGASQATNNMLASIPIYGEMSGAAAKERVTDGAYADMNAATNDVARFSPGAVTDRARKFLARQALEQNRNVEADRQANSVAVGQLQYGNSNPIVEVVKSIHHMFTASGVNQHS